MANAEKDLHTDIAIVGGGLTGGLAALALARRGFSIALIERSPKEALLASHFDGRTTAIAFASMRMLNRLGLWDDIDAFSEPIRDILVTDGQRQTRFREGGLSSFHMHFDSNALDKDTPLGWIVENHALRRAIFSALDKEKDVTVFDQTSCQHVDFGPGRAVLELSAGRSVTTNLVLAADGKQSPLRAQAGLRVNRWKYQQTGLVATVAHEHPHNGFAQEYFLPGGPFAILPMTTKSDGSNKTYRSSLVWTDKIPLAERLMASDDETFKRELTQRFGSYLGGLEVDGPRFSYPLSFHLSHKFVSARLALVGDAVRAIHPIAGQGFNLAIKDIAALCDVLADGRGVGLDIGHESALQPYQQWRRFDSVSLALGTDLLNRLFSNNQPAIRLMRGAGLGVVNASRPVRQFFMRQAGADVGTLPSLLQPL